MGEPERGVLEGVDEGSPAVTGKEGMWEQQVHMEL